MRTILQSGQNELSIIVFDWPCFELEPLQQNNDHPHSISQIRIFRPTFEKTLDCPSSIWVNNSYTIFETFLHKLVTGNYPILWQFTHPWVPIYRDIHLSDVVWRSIKILWEIWLLRTRLPKGRIDKLQSPLPAVGRPKLDKSKKNRMAYRSFYNQTHEWEHPKAFRKRAKLPNKSVNNVWKY